MTGVRFAFSELDTGIRGTVKFGDGSVVGIEGRGTVLFKCKGGEHQALEGVYHIPRLTANIVSLGQLDEEKYKWSCDDGVLRVWNTQRHLLAKVVRSANHLYILKLDITNQSASRRREATRPGSGTRGSATSTSARSRSSLATAWCADCP